MISAIKNSTMSEYRTKYHEADIVLIDNLQYLKGKENTQGELFTILEKRSSNGKQTILAGNLSPAEISFWDSQLATHITSGLCIQTQVPNSEERSQIVANKLKERGMDWPMETCRYVAHNTAFSWFQIDGEINKIVFLKELYNKQ
jgi:chromosomal replication initiator protein